MIPMLKWFRRKRDDKSLAGNAEQELSTIKKLDMAKRSMEKLENLFVERRFQILPISIDRRRSNG